MLDSNSTALEVLAAFQSWLDNFRGTVVHLQTLQDWVYDMRVQLTTTPSGPSSL